MRIILHDFVFYLTVKKNMIIEICLKSVVKSVLINNSELTIHCCNFSIVNYYNIRHLLSNSGTKHTELLTTKFHIKSVDGTTCYVVYKSSDRARS